MTLLKYLLGLVLVAGVIVCNNADDSGEIDDDDDYDYSSDDEDSILNDFLPEGISSPKEFKDWVYEGDSDVTHALGTTGNSKTAGRSIAGAYEIFSTLYQKFSDITVNTFCNCANFTCGCGLNIKFEEPPTTHKAWLGLRAQEGCDGIEGLELALELTNSKNKSESITMTLFSFSSVCQSFKNISACIEPYGFKFMDIPNESDRALRMCAQMNINYNTTKLYSVDLNCFLMSPYNGGYFKWVKPEDSERPSIGVINEVWQIIENPREAFNKYLSMIAETEIGKQVGQYIDETHTKVKTWVQGAMNDTIDAISSGLKKIEEGYESAKQEVKGFFRKLFGKRRKRSICWQK